MSLVKNKIINPEEEILSWLKTNILNLFSGVEECLNFNLEIPPSNILADYALPVFSIAKILNQNPSKVAIQLTEHCLKAPPFLVKAVYAAGPYINIQVNHESYYSAALEYIRAQEPFQKQDEKVVAINYFGSNSRSLLIGKRLGKYYESIGCSVFHNNLSSDNAEQFSVEGKEIIKMALDYSLAEYASSTKAVIVPGSNNYTGFVLQRNDFSLTKQCIYLANFKRNTIQQTPNFSVYIASVDEFEVVNSLLNIFDLLKFAPQGVQNSKIFINQNPISMPSLEQSVALKYAILRTSYNKKFFLSPEDLLIYDRLKDLIYTLKNPNINKSRLIPPIASLRVFLGPQFNISEPLNFYDLPKLCAYLEAIEGLYKEKLLGNDKHFYEAIAWILVKGLELLVD